MMSKPGNTTKLDIVNSTLSKISISGITAPAMGEDYSTVLHRLEGMMHELESTRNICCNYNFTTAPDGSDEHGMGFGLFEPISNILAIRVLQDYSIPPNDALLAAASAAVSSLSSATFQLRETQYPRRQPRGAGNTLRYNRWQRFYRKPDRVPIICSTVSLNTGEINDYTQSWADYLRPSEDIDSYTIMLTEGLRLVDDSGDDQTITYRLEGLNPTIDNGVENIRLRVITTDGRIDERLIAVEVLPVTTDDVRFVSEVD